MWPLGEFALGITTFLLGLAVIGFCVRFGRIPTRVSFVAALVIETLMIAGLGLDWGYDWLNRTALDVALNSNIWVALPHALALMILTMTLLWGPATAPWAVFLASVQTLSFLPVIYLVELDTDMSFLAATPLASMYGSVLAAFFLIPQACSSIPSEGSRWFLIAFGARQDLIRAIRSLSEAGLSVRPPETILESGSASGRIGPTDILVTTRPFLFPPSYALRIRWVSTGGTLTPVPVLPGFAPRERLVGEGRAREYLGLSSRGFQISNQGLFRFLTSIALSEEVETGRSNGRDFL